PRYYPDGTVTDVPEAFWVAELVREQLLAVAREELPHSITTRVTEWEWPLIRCEILVERESQKGIVIGRKGAVLKEVGTAVRKQLPEGAYIELHVKVDKDWQRRPSALDRLGFWAGAPGRLAPQAAAGGVRSARRNDSISARSRVRRMRGSVAT